MMVRHRFHGSMPHRARLWERLQSRRFGRATHNVATWENPLPASPCKQGEEQYHANCLLPCKHLLLCKQGEEPYHVNCSLPCSQGRVGEGSALAGKSSNRWFA